MKRRVIAGGMLLAAVLLGGIATCIAVPHDEPPLTESAPGGAKLLPTDVAEAGATSLVMHAEHALRAEGLTELPRERIECRDVAAWSDLPRLPNDAVRSTIRRPQAIEVHELYRSAAFNPRDLPLAPSDRDAIARIVTAGSAEAKAVVAEFDTVLAAEFAVAMASGNAQRIDLARVNGDVAFAALGPEPFFRTADGVTHGVRHAQMPRSTEGRTQLRGIGRDLVENLAKAFEAAGALSASEVDTIVAKARRVASGP